MADIRFMGLKAVDNRLLHHRRKKFIALALSIAGLIIVTNGFIFSELPLEQSTGFTGPRIRSQGEGYWTDFHVTPLIPKGARISIQILFSKPTTKSTFLTLEPSNLNGESMGPVLLRSEVKPGDVEANLDAYASHTSNYLLTISGFQVRYSIVISSKWPPLYWLRTHVFLLGVTVLFGGLFLYHYFREREFIERTHRI